MLTSFTLDSFISVKFDVNSLKLKMNIKFVTFRKLFFGNGLNIIQVACMPLREVTKTFHDDTG